MYAKPTLTDIEWETQTLAHLQVIMKSICQDIVSHLNKLDNFLKCYKNVNSLSTIVGVTEECSLKDPQD